MRRVLSFVLAGLISLGTIFGFQQQAQAILCPTTCLLGGIVLQGIALSSSVELPGDASAQSVNRTYNYTWTVVDLTDDLPEPIAVNIIVEAEGTDANGLYTGTGQAYVFTDFNQVQTSVNVTDVGNGALVTMLGSGSETFLLAAVAGIGTADYSSSSDPDFDGDDYYCGDCF